MLACDVEYKCSISTWMYACGADQLLVGKIEKVAKIKKSGDVIVVVFVPGVNESLDKSVSEYLEKGGGRRRKWVVNEGWRRALLGFKK